MLTLLRGLTCPAVPAGVFVPSTPIKCHSRFNLEVKSGEQMLHVLSRTASPLIRFVQWILQWAVDFHSRHFAFRGLAVSRINANAPAGSRLSRCSRRSLRANTPINCLTKVNLDVENPANECYTCAIKNSFTSNYVQY